MCGHCLGKDGSNFLGVDLGSALELEALIRLHISGFTFKSMGFVLAKTNH